MESVLLALILVVTTATLLIGLYLVRKARWIIARLNRLGMQSDHHFKHFFRQIQILAALTDQLKLPHPLPPTGAMAATPDFLKALADHAARTKPQTVVECGYGISTIVLARCLQLNGSGHVYSMEHLPAFAEATREELIRHNLAEWATILDSPLVGNWYRTDGIPDEIDMLIVDGPPANTCDHPRYPAGPKLFSRVTGTIFIDDAGRDEELADIERWKREFPKFRFNVNLHEFQKGLCIATSSQTSV